jgi:hypothetical protein
MSDPTNAASALIERELRSRQGTRSALIAKVRNHQWRLEDLSTRISELDNEIADLKLALEGIALVQAQVPDKETLMAEHNAEALELAKKSPTSPTTNPAPIPPGACLECAGTKRDLGYAKLLPADVADGRARAHDVQVMVYISCSTCSNQIESMMLDDFLNRLPASFSEMTLAEGAPFAAHDFGGRLFGSDDEVGGQRR